MPQDDTLKRLGRVLSLITKLNNGSIELAEVMEEFDVNKRTIQRDLAIMKKAGLYTTLIGKGKYTFEEGVSFTDRPLTTEQYNVLNAMAAFAKNAGGGMFDSFEKLFRHITAYSPFDTFIMPVMPRILADTIPNIKEIEAAIENNTELEIEYQGPDSEKTVIHHICPLKVLVADGFAYIFSAYKTRPGIFPKYRIDRIKNIKTLDGQTFSEPEGMQGALEKARSIWGAMPEKDRKIKVKLKVEDWARDYFMRHELVGGQTVKKQKDGTIIFEAKICQLPEMVPHILRWMPNVTVIAPKELKAEVLKRVKEFTKKQK